MLYFLILARELSKQLDHAMKTREPECFCTSEFNIMRFLDPCLRDTLSITERDSVIKSLFHVNARVFESKETAGMVDIDPGIKIKNFQF